MNLNFFNKLFRKKNKENVKDNNGPVNNASSSNSIDKNINIEYNKNLIKIEIKKDCDFQEYCNEIDRRLQENISKMDNNMIDMINEIPIRMLISNGIKTINRQTVYLTSTDEYEYIISLNAENIRISERRIVNKEIEESTIQIYYPNREYKISKYVHDLNRSTKSVKSYIPGRKSGIQFFDMNKEEAILTAKTLMQHLEKNESIRDTLDLKYISSFLSFDESPDVLKIEDNTKDIDEKSDEQLEY